MPCKANRLLIWQLMILLIASPEPSQNFLLLLSAGARPKSFAELTGHPHTFSNRV